MHSMEALMESLMESDSNIRRGFVCANVSIDLLMSTYTCI